MRPLGWAETFVKITAFVVAYCTIFLYPGTEGQPNVPIATADAIRFWSGAVLTLGLVFGIYDRFLDRELFAMCFIFANIGAHGSYLYAVLAGFPPKALWLFPALMLAGDLIKLASIKLYNMRVRDIAQWVLYVLVAVYLLGDVLMLLPAVIG